MKTALTSNIRPLTRRRMIIAVSIAAVADIIQIGLGPVGWTFFDEIVDVVVMLIMTRLIGFHWLLLPTFLLEFVPLADMLPTWTGCVIFVVRLRSKQQKRLQELPPVAESKPSNPY